MTRPCSDRTGGNAFKQVEDMFRLDNGKIFIMRVVRHQNRLLREVANAPSLEAFKGRLEDDPAHSRTAGSR